MRRALRTPGRATGPSQPVRLKRAVRPPASPGPRRTFRAAPRRPQEPPPPPPAAAPAPSAAAPNAPGPAFEPDSDQFDAFDDDSEFADEDDEGGEDENEDEMSGSDYDVVGEEVYGVDDVEGDVYGYQTVGRSRRRRARGGALAGPMIQLPPKPKWRNQIAPGVPMPGEGTQPLPLQPNLNNGVFNAANNIIQFTARPQAPFRPERLLASVRRSGAAGVIIQAQNLFIGRELQLVELGNFDIEFFSATAFGVRLALSAAQPGVLITITCQAVPAVAGADTVATSLMFLGRSLHG